jgi:hypothetical protein
MTEKNKTRSKTGERPDKRGMDWLMRNRSNGKKSTEEVNELWKKNFGVDKNAIKGSNTDELKEKK